MEWTQVIAILVAVMLAFVGYFATYLDNLRIARRRDRLDRINRQLKELYGPLLAAISTGDAMCADHD